MAEKQRAAVDLASYNNDWYQPGGRLKRLLWYLCNALLFNTAWFPFRSIKIRLLRLFGASVGNGVVLKPYINIKYPWFLSIGDYCWIGEGVWIDCLTEVTMESHVCISQGALILSGNHDYKSTSFDLLLKPISLKRGAWVGAKALVTQGTVMETHAVLTAGSVATGNLEAYGIYQGNPARKVKDRQIAAQG
jgi:putative colanic acid biosynthesis acetyltransferase WcaF